MENSNIIRIEITEANDVHASSADVFITIAGSSFHSGDQVLRKTKEVGQLVQKLADIGIGADDIRVEAVEGQVDRGVLSSSSSARYTLRVRCVDLDAISEILGAVTSLKAAKFQRIAWRYGDLEKLENDLLEAALRKSRERANLAARALGTRIVGIRECSIKSQMPESQEANAMRYGIGGGRSVSREDLGMEVVHSASLEVRVLVRYLVEGFEN